MTPQAVVTRRGSARHNSDNTGADVVAGVGAAGLGATNTAGVKLADLGETPGHTSGESCSTSGPRSYSQGSGGVGAGSSGAGGAGHSSSIPSTPQPVVEVIGAEDRAARLAYSTTRVLAARGEDLLAGKVDINANTKEIFGVPLDSAAIGTSDEDEYSGSKSASGTSSRGHRAVGAVGAVGAAGFAGVYAAHKASSGSKPDASFNTPEREVDPNKFHRQHQEVKRELEAAADVGVLGNVPGQQQTAYSGTSASGTSTRGVGSDSGATSHISDQHLGGGHIKGSAPDSLRARTGSTEGSAGITGSEFDSTIASELGRNKGMSSTVYSDRARGCAPQGSYDLMKMPGSFV